MLLLTGATGRVGSALLGRLLAARTPVRCLVRDPRRLGEDRVRVQIALGDLGDPASFRNALRGVRTVVHLAATERDQPHASIEEIDGVAVWRLLRAAERAGAEHFLFVSALGATPHSRARMLRAKALAEEVVAGSSLRTTVLRASLIYSPGDRRLELLTALSLLPAVPVTQTMARARSQPVAAADVAACVHAAIDRGGDAHAAFDVAGPDTLTNREVVERLLEIMGRSRRLVTLPSSLILRGLGAYETLTGPIAFTTRDEADLLASTMVSAGGVPDAQALGVTPRALAAVLG